MAYGAAKAALNAFGKGISEEFGPRGVRVSTISPAATRTALWEGEQSFGADVAAAMGVSQGQMIEAMPAQMGMLTLGHGTERGGGTDDDRRRRAGRGRRGGRGAVGARLRAGALRGFALLGIALVNVRGLIGMGLPALGPADRLVENFVTFFVQGRFYALSP